MMNLQDAQELMASGMMGTDFLSIAEAAATIKVTEETLRRAIRDGRIPAYGTAGRLRVRISDIMPLYAPIRKKERVSHER